MPLECKLVKSKRDVKAFIDFPHELYRNDPCYVPEIFLGQKAMFEKKSYPFYHYGHAELFLAMDGDRIVGRVASIDNPRYNEFHNTNIGFFGFFDCIQDERVAGILLNQVKQRALARGYESVLGPTNYTTNETAGVLIDGFDTPPYVLMTYNFQYYPSLLEANEFHKTMDLFAYQLLPDSVDEKSLKYMEDIEKRLQTKGIRIRKANLKNINQEAAIIKKVYNAAWEKNWGFVPFTDAEFDYLTRDLKPVIDPDFTFIAEKEGEPIGFSITLPNLNEILIKNKKGRLFPWGLFRILTGKHKTSSVRILALGVVPEFRKLGVESLFYARTILAARRRKKTAAEASWILENNIEMNNALQKLNGKVYKTYRLYSVPLRR